MNTSQSLDKLMTKHPLTVGYEDSIQQASEMMIEHRFRHLPVTDQLGDVIGILSDRDIQRAMETRRHGIEVEMVIAPHRKVKDFMSWPPHAVPDSTPLVDVVKFMVQEKISALLVNSANTGKVRGIITTEDVLKEFARTLEIVPQAPFSMLNKQ
jgi:acetoin utilization protein AcuB